MPEYIVFYCKVVEDKEVGILVDFPFYGGEATTEADAEIIARTLVNEQQQNQITLIPKVFEKLDGQTITDVMEEARKRFDKMSRSMYDCEEVMDRRKKKKKR